MAEFTANEAQTVAVGQNVLFTDTVVPGCACIRHRRGSGIFNLRGGHRYLVTFGANITGPTAEVPVSLAIAIAGEAVPATTMIVTPATAGGLNNVSSSVYIDVPCGCCYNVAIENNGTLPVTMQNANIIITGKE